MTREPLDPADDAPEPEVVSIEAHQHPGRRDQDGVESLRDTEAEDGAEEGVDDAFEVDDRALREVGADLDGRDEPEPKLT